MSLVLLWALVAGLLGCASQNISNLQRYEFSRVEMAVPFRIVVYASSSIEASNAAFTAFARVHELNGILSDYDSDSELSRLSQSSSGSTAVKVSEDLWNVLWKAHEISQLSSGAFDVTVGPVVNLWRKARRENKFPRNDLLAETLARVGYTNLVLNPRDHTVKLLHSEMRLDVGGIGKGYALDEALKVLKSRHLSRALVTGGGDMAVGDPPPGKPGWRIELPPLDVTNAPPARFLLLKRRGFATSGDLFQRLEINGKRYSHIVDPRTGIGLTDHSLVNVVAKDATTADALSKVVSVLGPNRGFPIVEQKNAVARVVRKPGERIEISQSGGFARLYE